MFEQGQYKMFQEFSSPSPKPVFRRSRTSRLVYMVIVVLILGVILTLLNIYELHKMRLDHEKHTEELVKIPVMEGKGSDQTYATQSSPIVWLQGSPKSKNNGPNGYLKHVYLVFERIGYTIGEKLSDWIVMWSHDYPFVVFSSRLKYLKPYQKVNHFPGSGFITNKLNLAQTSMEFIPRAFQLPEKKNEFLAFAEKNKNTSWVQKSNKHRGIKIETSESIDFKKEGTFVQEYVAKPFLIDGRKFDIGVYSIITSIDPLRAYYIGGDVLFRFCPAVYHPFDPANLDKYVIGDDYLPLWKVPSLATAYLEQKLTFKTTFDNYLISKGKNVKLLWENIHSAIRQVFLAKEKDLIGAVRNYPSKRNFFEMMRFDFVLDENLKPYLMEANMSPNLSSDHFLENARLYEHVIYNLLGLVGVTHTSSYARKKIPDYKDSTLVSNQDIHVFPEFCTIKSCSKNCSMLKCKLCRECLSDEMEIDLKQAYLEHNRRGSARRIFPPPINQTLAETFSPDDSFLDAYSTHNKLMYMWYIGKCRLDPGWCY